MNLTRTHPSPGHLRVIRRRKRAGAICLVITAAAFLLWNRLHSDDPVFEGKHLSTWLADCNPKLEVLALPADEQDPETAASLRRARAAASALRTLGPNAVPHLLKLASATETAARRKARSTRVDEWALVHLHSQKLYRALRSFIEKPWNDHRLAEAGFQTLGPKARSAVPGLVRLLQSPDPDTRETAANCLATIGSAAEPAISALIQRINDPNGRVEDAAVEALFAIGMKPEVAVPALAKLLEADEGDFDRAMHLLANFGDAAKPAVPAILPFLAAEDAELREKATNVLKQIDPQAAAKAGMQ